MSLSFPEHLDLLELHGRIAVAVLAPLDPQTPVPPDNDSALGLAQEHYDLMTVWAWLLENPDASVSQWVEPAAPATFAALVAGIGLQLDRLVASLNASGSDGAVEYFDRPGTTGEVARLLAHEAVVLAHRASLAAGRTTVALEPAVASDGADRLLGHLSSPWPDGDAPAHTVLLHATGSGADWYVSVPDLSDHLAGELLLVPAGTPAAVVEGQAEDLLWWVHGHTDRVVSITGGDSAVRAILRTFDHPVAPPAKRKRRWFSRG